MEGQVQELLNEERKVNSQVKQALQAKREKLATITQHTERAVANERRELQDELNQKIALVSNNSLSLYLVYRTRPLFLQVLSRLLCTQSFSFLTNVYFARD